MSAAARACGELTAMSALMPAVLPDIAAHCVRISKENNTTVEVANINSKEQVVISGTLKGVAAVEAAAIATKAARKCTRLNVSAPFHCSIMQPAAADLAPMLQATAFTASTIPVLSNVTTQPYGLHVASLLIDQVRCELGVSITREHAHVVIAFYCFWAASMLAFVSLRAPDVSVSLTTAQLLGYHPKYDKLSMSRPV